MREKGKILSVSAIGLDSPGLVSKITTTVFEMGGNIIDVEESCRRGLFSIFLVIDFAASRRTCDEVLDALYAVGEEVELKVVVNIYDEETIPFLGEKENHIVTILGEDQPGVIARISTLFHKHNVNIEQCKMIARGEFFSMEMTIDTGQIHVFSGRSRDEAVKKMKHELKELCSQLNQSYVIQSENIYHRSKKLVVFDVDSSLIQETSMMKFLDEVEGQVQTIEAGTNQGKQKKPLIQGLMENAQRLKGTRLADLERFSDILELNPGTIELIGILKSMGFKIALLSSGLNFIVKRIFEAAGVDYAFSNTLKCDEKGVITGEIEKPVITNENKNELLEFIMKLENIAPEQVIAVGDGSTRSHFIKNVGLSIAFKPDEKELNADCILSGDQIINVLYCLGIPELQLEKHLKAKSLRE